MANIVIQCNNPECGIPSLTKIPTRMDQEGEAYVGMLAGPGYNIQCPHCGGETTVPAGTYAITPADNHTSKIARLIDGPQKTKDLVSQVEFLIALLEKGKPTKETVIAEVEKISPALADISRKTVNHTTYALWIALMLQLLTFLKEIHLGYFKPEEKPSVNKEFVDYLLKENQQLKKEQADARASTRTTPVKATAVTGRNELCHCGSGIKFKRCHGRK